MYQQLPKICRESGYRIKVFSGKISSASPKMASSYTYGLVSRKLTENLEHLTVYTDVIEYAAGHLLHISRVYAGKHMKTFVCNFNYSAWMNTIWHTSLLHIWAVEQTVLWDARHSHNTEQII